MATRKKPAAERAAKPSASATKPGAPTVLWMHDAPVCVEIVDTPAPVPRDGVCRCPACHGAEFADWADRFLP